MQLTHITSTTLRRLIEMVENKEKLIDQVEKMENEIAKEFGTMATTATTATKVIKTSGKAIKKARKSMGANTNFLKDQILSLLESAGKSGLHVKDIAEKVGRPVTNISVWFSTTGKKHARRVKPGHFAAKSSSKPVAVSPVATPAPVKTKQKGGLTPEGRAKLAANMKARWAARRKANANTASSPATPTRKNTKRSKFPKVTKP